MVLYHIAQLPDLIVIRPATFDAYHFPDGNLNVVNAGVIPLTVDKAVGKAQDKKVLNGLFAEVMIDAVDRFFIEVLRERLIHFDRRFEILTNGFLDDDSAVSCEAVRSA